MPALRQLRETWQQSYTGPVHRPGTSLTRLKQQYPRHDTYVICRSSNGYEQELLL